MLDLELFGRRLIAARGDRSLHDVSAATKIADATISRWERGQNAPNVADFVTLCIYYDLHPLNFLHCPGINTGGKDEMSPEEAAIIRKVRMIVKNHGAKSLDSVNHQLDAIIMLGVCGRRSDIE